MKKNLLFRILLAFLFCTILDNQNAAAQEVEFITPLSINPLALTEKAQSAISRVQSNTNYREVQYVKIGDLSKIQKNGVLTFSLPGVGKRIVASAVRVTVKSKTEYDWYGELADSLGYVNILYRDGKCTANISVDGHLYEIYHIDGDTHVILTTVIDPTISDCESVSSNTPSSTVTNLSNGRINYESECISYVRILVLYTPSAKNAVANIGQTVDMCISNFNSCVYNSGVTSRVVAELAGQGEYSFTEGQYISNDLTSFRTDPLVHQLRDNSNADLVVLLTNGGYANTWGKSATVDLESTLAYAAVEVSAAVSYRQSFAHEVGHLYSLRHQFDPGPSAEWRQYAHACVFNVGLFQNRGTIMVGADEMPNSGRLLRFSNPNQTVSGTPTGTTTDNDNARRINETYNTVNGFKPDIPRPFYAVVVGPGSGMSRQWYTWEAGMSCGVAPYTFEWRTSYDGFNYGSVRGTNETFTDNLPCPDGNYFFVKVTVYSSNGQSSSATQSVYLDKQLCNNPGGRIAADNPVGVNNDEVLLYEIAPNPVISIAHIQYYLPKSQHIKLDVVNTWGQLVRELANDTQEAGIHSNHFSTITLPAGLYFYRLETEGKSQTKRMVVIR